MNSLRDDFRRGYLFSGEINPEIYAPNCVFTDPTLSFSGLNTFRRNINNLKPIGANLSQYKANLNQLEPT